MQVFSLTHKRSPICAYMNAEGMIYDQSCINVFFNIQPEVDKMIVIIAVIVSILLGNRKILAKIKESRPNLF